MLINQFLMITSKEFVKVVMEQLKIPNLHILIVISQLNSEHITIGYTATIIPLFDRSTGQAIGERPLKRAN